MLGAQKLDVDAFVAHLVAYDRKECRAELRRGQPVNLYRLGHLLESAQHVRDYVSRGMPIRDAIKTQFAANANYVAAFLRKL